MTDFLSANMTKAQQARLKLRAPQLLRRDVALDFPQGWFDLVYDTCVTLNNDLVAKIATQAVSFALPKVSAIVCSYGKLRFQCEQADEKMTTIMRSAEQVSISLCMCCGQKGHQERRRNTLVTFCDQHRQVG